MNKDVLSLKEPCVESIRKEIGERNVYALASATTPSTHFDSVEDLELNLIDLLKNKTMNGYE